MFEGLDRIDWSKLGHAYGPATDVPGLLRQLASADPDERAEAIHELYGNIWHQGTVYEASAEAVPFLIELLESDDVEGKDEVLILLAHLAKGTSYHDVHQHLPLLKGEAQKVEWQEEIQKELGWVQRVKAAVRAGEDVYLGILDNNDSRLRDAAAYLLASLERPAPRLADKVWRRLEKEQDEPVQASLLLTFGILAEPTEPNRGPVLAMLVNAASKSVKLAAAMALVHCAPTELPEEALVTLLDAAQSPEGYDVWAESVWAQVDELEQLVMNHLALLDAKSVLAAETRLPTPCRRGNTRGR